MNRTIRRTSKMLIVALILSLFAFPMTSASAATEKNAAQNKAISQVSNLLTKGYSPYYDILGIKTEITKVEDTEDSLDVYVKTTMNTILKAKSVAELPHVQGMMEALKLNDLKKDSVENTVKAIKQNNDLKMNDIQIKRVAKLLQDKITDVEPYIGTPDHTNFMFKFTIPKTKDGIVAGSGDLLFEDNDEYVPAEHILPKSSQEMIKDGIEEVMTAINNSESDKNANRLYSGYNRLDARDYAIANCSWATTYCSHGKAQQDITYWNTGHYPAYLYNFCHNDCADFVSQALHYGGIPKTSTWTRGYADQSWTWAWQNCYGLKQYMLNNGYWTPSNYTNAAAGGIRLWKEKDENGNWVYNHIGMIVKNDTITREFNAHTYDRSHYAYSDQPNKEYYILW